LAEAGLVISQLCRRPGPRLERLLEACGPWSLGRVPEPDWLAGRRHRRSFHWGLGPAEIDFKKAFCREGLDWRLKELEVELFSFDLGPAARRHLLGLPLSRPLGPSAILRRSRAALAMVRRFYRGPMAAENYNFYPTGFYDHITEPDFIDQYLTELDLGLVLDLAHAQISAHNLGRPIWDYLQALPLEKVRELHLSRPWLPGRPGLLAVDEHQAPGEREWTLLEKLLKSGRLPQATVVLLEYYRDLGKLVKAQARLVEILTGP
jgi:hypothetical protein